MGTEIDPTDVWNVIGIIITTGGTVLVAWLTAKAKQGADEKDEEAAPVIADTASRRDLSAVVDHLVDQMAEMQEEIKRMKPVVQVKYPLAISHIRSVHKLYPDSGLEIPPQIRDDL